MTTFSTFQSGDLVALPTEYHEYSRILQLHAPNPFASRFENIPNTNYGLYCFKPFVVVTLHPDFIYCAPITSRKQKHEQSNMHGDILPVYNHYHVWSESIAVNNMIPIPVDFLLPLTEDNLPRFRSYQNGGSPTEDWACLPIPESIDVLALRTRADTLRSEVEKRTNWALRRCPDFPACERFCTLYVRDPEGFSDPKTQRFVQRTKKTSHQTLSITSD